MPSRGRPRGGRGCEGAGVGDRFISTAGRQSGREGGGTFRPNRRLRCHSPPKSTQRATTAPAATTRKRQISFDGKPKVVKDGIYVHGWQPRPPFLTCSERSLRSRPPELLYQNGPVLPDNDQRPRKLLGSFVHHTIQQPAPRAGTAAGGAVGSLVKQHACVDGRHHHHDLQQPQGEMYNVDSIKCSSRSSSKMLSSHEPPNDKATGLLSTPPRSVGGYAAVYPTKSMEMSMSETGSDAICRMANTTLTGQQSPSYDKTGTGCKRLSAISTWWDAFVEQAVIFASANRAHTTGGREGRLVETHLAALLAETFVDTACQNVRGYGLTQRHRQRQSNNTAQLIPPRGTDDAPAAAAVILPGPQTSQEGGKEETPPVLLQGTPSEDRPVGATSGWPSGGSFAREFVAEVIGDRLLEAVAVAIAAARRPTAQLAASNVEEQDITASAPQAEPSAATDRTWRLPEKAAKEEDEEVQPHHQKMKVHDENDDYSGAKDAQCSGSDHVLSPASGFVATTRVPSPTPPTAATGNCADTAHPPGLQVVRLPGSPLLDCCRQPGSAASANGGTAVDQRARSSSAAISTNREDSRCTPCGSRKRLRNGTFVRIINVPVKNTAGIGHAVTLEAANSGSEAEARAGARCWQPCQMSYQSSRQEEPPATPVVPQRPRPHTAVLPGVVGIGDGRVSAVAARPPDTTVKQGTKSAGAVRSTAGVERAQNGRSGGARLQLRRNRWCSPCVVGDGGSMYLEGSVTSLLTTPSCSGAGGGSSREKLPSSAVDGDAQKTRTVDESTPRRPPPRGQAHHISDAPERAGRRNVDSNRGVVDGDLPGTTRMIYGVAIGGEARGGAERAAGEEEEVDLPSMKSSERVFPPLSYRYKNHVQGSGPNGGTELSVAAAAVTAAAAAAVAAAAAAAERSEREAVFWRNCSNSLKADGVQSSGGSVVSAEYGTRDCGGADGDRARGWKASPPPKPRVERSGSSNYH